jgi:hypothetical protein
VDDEERDRRREPDGEQDREHLQGAAHDRVSVPW